MFTEDAVTLTLTPTVSCALYQRCITWYTCRWLLQHFEEFRHWSVFSLHHWSECM